MNGSPFLQNQMHVGKVQKLAHWMKAKLDLILANQIAPIWEISFYKIN